MTEDIGIPLHEQVGFNYAQAMRDLLDKLTNEELALRIGYNSVGSINEIIRRGRTPNHRHGEALWALYIQVFGKKPPLDQNNARQEVSVTVQA